MWSYMDELRGALSQEGFGQELDLPAAVLYMGTIRPVYFPISHRGPEGSG